MIVNEAKKNVVVSGDFEQTQFKLKADPKAFNILSDKIYTNKVKAVIREISTNAYDAHIAAGNDEPFDVHLPTSLEPWFSVRDYGTGLSHQDCMEIYTTYFYSTKTDSNDYVGALGLGSKSPFAITDSFTVASWFNGEKLVYSAYKDENDCPQFALLTSDETDEPNGIEVSVAVDVDDFYEFDREAVEVYKYFDKLPNINVTSVTDRISKAFDRYKVRTKDFATTTSWGDMTCVMGNVGYSVEYRDVGKWLIDSSVDYDIGDIDVILYFEIGEINFTPGRESLSLDQTTKDAIIAKLTLVKRKVGKVIQTQIDDCKNYYEAKCLYESMSRQFKHDCQYEGEPLKFSPELPNSAKCYYSEHHSASVKSMDVDTGYYDDKTEYFWNKKGYVGRIRHHLKELGYRDNRRVVLVEAEHLPAIGIDSSYVQDLEDLDKPESTYGYRTVDKCKIYEYNGKDSVYGKPRENWNESTVDLNDGEERVYVEINHFKVTNQKWFVNEVYQIRNSVNELKKHIGEVTVYGVKSVLLKSKGFQKGNWIRLDEYLKREMTKVAPKVINKFTGNSTMAMLFCALADRIDNKKFTEFRDLYKAREDNSLIRILENIGINVEESDRVDVLYKEIDNDYPIFDLLNIHSALNNVDKVVKYIQA